MPTYPTMLDMPPELIVYLAGELWRCKRTTSARAEMDTSNIDDLRAAPLPLARREQLLGVHAHSGALLPLARRESPRLAPSS